MNFDELNKTIPYAIGGKEKVLTMNPYPGVTLAMPGRHQKDTTPLGGDFLVMVNDETVGWELHQFTHTDIFKDIELKYEDVPNATYGLLQAYFDIVLGADPDKLTLEYTDGIFDGLGVEPQTFLYAVQCLAVAEYRRYAFYENKHGGRYLPFRFAAGIVEGLWTATDAAALQKKGRPGVEQLERLKGVPVLTKELMDA